MKAILGILLALLLLASPAVAQAVGPVVSKNCVFGWAAITVDNAVPPLPLTTGTMTYALIIASGVQTTPAIPPVATTVGTSIPGQCVNLIAGQQYTAWVQAINTPPAPGTPMVSTSAPVPFVIATPPPPVQTPATPVLTITP